MLFSTMALNPNSESLYRTHYWFILLSLVIFEISLYQHLFSFVPDLENWATGIPDAIGVSNNASKKNRVLRLDWTNNPPLSRIAQEILHSQSNCSLPTADFHVDNAFGFGSHLALWSQAVCNAWDMPVPSRIRTQNPQWLWLDQTICDVDEQVYDSPLLCYFPKSEVLCPNDNNRNLGNSNSNYNNNDNVTDPRNSRKRCKRLSNFSDEESLVEFRAASTEYLFRQLSPIVIQEAERQVDLLFGPTGVPDDLITVHIRWGDKFWEMDLARVEEYIHAVSSILHQRGKSKNNITLTANANIYLATEDPKAVEEFEKAAPKDWKIYRDRTIDEIDEFRPKRGNRASHASKNTKGRAGLVGLGSLLVAMEARDFVLTTGSNWSRLMNQLRTNIIDPRCGNCTKMIDLRPGIW